MKRLAEQLGCDVDRVAEIRRGLKTSYCCYWIPKTRGFRRIEAPCAPLKALQRLILDRLLYALEAHPAAHGFCPGKNICTHAAMHVGRRWVVNADIADFFPSVSGAMLKGIPEELGLSGDAAQCMLDLVTMDDHLPQGAPSSPHLGNLALRTLDAQIAQAAEASGWSYSRYADDLVVSGESDPGAMLHALHEAIRAHGFRVNPHKSKIMGRHRRQWVTGLVVNAGVKMPRETRRMLRAGRRRLQQEASTAETQSLRGHLAFLEFVERQEKRLCPLLVSASLSGGISKPSH